MLQDGEFTLVLNKEIFLLFLTLGAEYFADWNLPLTLANFWSDE